MFQLQCHSPLRSCPAESQQVKQLLKRGFQSKSMHFFMTPRRPNTRWLVDKCNPVLLPSESRLSLQQKWKEMWFVGHLNAVLWDAHFQWNNRTFKVKHAAKTSFEQLLYTGKTTTTHLYLAFGHFSQRFSEEGSPGREKVFLRVLLQAAVAAAHRAIPRHLRGGNSGLEFGRINPPPPPHHPHPPKKVNDRKFQKTPSPDKTRSSGVAVSISLLSAAESFFLLPRHTESTDMAPNSFNCSHVMWGKRFCRRRKEKKKSGTFERNCLVLTERSLKPPRGNSGFATAARRHCWTYDLCVTAKLQ